MQIEHLTLRNWRNFRSVDVDLQLRVFLIGPNASGKTNFLDALRFLRDVVQGGLQAAVAARRGVHLLRNLAASPDADIEIAVAVVDDGATWTYRLVFNHDSALRACVRQESLSRLNDTISQDVGVAISEPIYQTLLERLSSHDRLGSCAEFFKSISSPLLVRDHFPGAGFLQRIWQTADLANSGAHTHCTHQKNRARVADRITATQHARHRCRRSRYAAFKRGLQRLASECGAR